METFSYKAVDASGKDVKGAVEAESKDEAARKIKEQGFTPISIGKQGALDKDVNLSFFWSKENTGTRYECILPAVCKYS